MDATPRLLAEHVRAKRHAIDNDLELIRVRLYRLDARRAALWRRLVSLLPVLAGAAVGTVALWVWMRRRRHARLHLVRRAS